MAANQLSIVVTAETRRLVIARAGARCEYCRMHDSLQGATFHVEHIVPRSTGGTDDVTNLAWACPSCNLHKSDRVSVGWSGSSDIVALFNPRLNEWAEHFDWDDYSLIGKTVCGKATIEALCLNTQRRQKIRQAEQLFGLFPPEE